MFNNILGDCGGDNILTILLLLVVFNCVCGNDILGGVCNVLGDGDNLLSLLLILGVLFCLCGNNDNACC